MPVGSERGGAVDESAVLLQALRDALLPFQTPDGSGVESGEECEVRVEVVVLPKPFHDLDELHDQTFTFPSVLLLENFRSGKFIFLVICRWMDYLLNIWPFTLIKFAQYHDKFAKVGSKYCQMPPKNLHSLFTKRRKLNNSNIPLV